MREFVVYAPAKLNLYLDVVNKREDGYHNIETLFEKIDLKDEIIIKEKKSKGIEVRVEPENLCPEGRENIAYKAAHALLKEAGSGPSLKIVIKKKIPVLAGLGGGSSDAASILCSINERFELGVSQEKLFSIASEIGKDIPFFMMDAPFAIARGTGEILDPLETNTSFAHIIIKPDISISTARMYERIDSLKGRRKKLGIASVISAVKKREPVKLQKSSYNIFEEVLGEYKVFVEKAKNVLLKSGAASCFLSGKGPSVFSIFKDKKEAMRILERIPKEQGLKVFLAMTYKGGIYGDKRG